MGVCAVLCSFLLVARLHHVCGHGCAHYGCPTLYVVAAVSPKTSFLSRTNKVYLNLILIIMKKYQLQLF